MTRSASEPAAANDYRSEHVALLLRSHRRLTGRDLLAPAASPAATARALYHTPFVVLSHDTAADPVFTYANLAAQRVFAMRWHQIVGMPSRYSAEAPARDERQRLLERVSRDGYIDDYSGVRIAGTGQRFSIANATVWNLIGTDEQVVGQAATFSEWTPLGDS